MSSQIKQQIIELLAKEGKLQEISKYIQNIKIEKNSLSILVEFVKEENHNIVEIEKLCEKAKQCLQSYFPEKEIKFVLTAPQIAHAPQAFRKTKEKIRLPKVKKVIVIASGKGGVGKSSTAVNLACALSQAGKSVGLLDADIYGPSIPKMLGVLKQPKVKDEKLEPIQAEGLELMSVGFLVPDQEAMVWRGPMLTKMLYQMMHLTNWGVRKPLDYLIIDTPPGTGDLHLTLAENYYIDGFIVVSTPQELALIDAAKALNMADKLSLPILGVISNMSYINLPGSEAKYLLFGVDKLTDFVKRNGLKLLAEIPFMQELAVAEDTGRVMSLHIKATETKKVFTNLAEKLVGLVSSPHEEV